MPGVIVRSADYCDLKEVIEEIFSKFPLALSGKRVFVKPNILLPYEVEKAVTTHPSLGFVLAASSF
ncbi:MAG: hypothetical protein QMD53_03845 [Actinomycetota bacterium]|nr:hypothetical protein [Actinomycetota bacterium]